MNERIKLFEKQCWDYQSNCLDAEKFAMLVVQECTSMLREIDWAYDLPYEHSENAVAVMAAKFIEEHFGIEE